MNARVLTAIALLSSLSLHSAFADETPVLSPNTSSASSAELTRAIQGMDEAQIQQAGLEQAEEIRALPDEMAKQGTPLSDTQKTRFNQLADQMASDASSPGFKDRIVSALRASESGLKRIAIDTGEGLGYAGTIVFSVSVSPFLFGSDFVSAMITGRGQITVGGNNNLEAILGYSGGLVIYYYLFTALKAAGYYTLNTPVLFSSLAVVVVDKLICTRLADDEGSTELDHFCATNDKIMDDIAGTSARGGNSLGRMVHKPLVKVCDGAVDLYKWLRHVFDRNDPIGSLTPCEPSPSPSVSPSASPEPSPSPSASPSPAAS
jgi:hypothetical protein